MSALLPREDIGSGDVPVFVEIRGVINGVAGLLLSLLEEFESLRMMRLTEKFCATSSAQSFSLSNNIGSFASGRGASCDEEVDPTTCVGDDFNCC